MVLRQNGSLGEFYSLLVVDWFVTEVCNCKGGCVWRRLVTLILWGNVLRSVTGITEAGNGLRSNQVNVSSILNVSLSVEKWILIGCY